MRIEALALIVACSQVFNSFGLLVGMIVSRHMIGYKIDNHFQTSLVGTVDEILEFLHTVFHFHGQIRIYIVVILDSIRRTGLTFNNCRMILLNAVSAVIGLRGMFDNSRVPNVCCSQMFDFIQCFCRKIGHLATSVFFYASIILECCCLVSKKSGKDLIYNYLLAHSIFFRINEKGIFRFNYERCPY